MKNNFIKLIGLMFIFSTLATTVSAFDQPYMKAARNDLNKARTALKRATDDKGGHRNNAISLIDRAILQVDNGIEYDKKNPNNRPRSNNDFEETSVGSFDQPNMKIALERLQDALDNLEKATADKGGYRVNAMNLVRDAVSEVKKGIEYDRNH
jgi:hypothetical protein